MKVALMEFNEDQTKLLQWSANRIFAYAVCSDLSEADGHTEKQPASSLLHGTRDRHPGKSFPASSFFCCRQEPCPASDVYTAAG
ncbi:hypothetical protein EYF80_016643 [Liparis tanakae]|uniref:Uncharacterized protein n=1 Tax=Liparis tanakae TaxID=230148 RepID=A0A4Z2I563_9TELE|nr:hypothetical protein EYF80_016643 [Liparis tanakae]